MPSLQTLAIYIIPLIFAITLHEAAHAYVAHRFGDDTAKHMGRLSLNPLVHIDLIGTILFPLLGLMAGGFMFGWAKPVPINYARLVNPKKNILWIALAGPLANFFMALVWLLIISLSAYLSSYFANPISLMAKAGLSINISLMIINLLPILPLDGGRIVYSLLPDKQAYQYSKSERYGMIILLGLLVFGGLSFILQPIYNIIINLLLNLI